MSAIKITFDDKLFKKALIEAPNKTKKFLRKTMHQSALLVQNDAKKLAPHDTGQLRRSITNKVTSEKAQIGTDIVYAPIQEYGGTIRAKRKPYLHFKTKSGNWVKVKSVFIKGKPYLRPALKKNTIKIIKKFNRLAEAINLK